MSLLNPLRYRGTTYDTPKQVKEARRQRSIDVIEKKKGLRGFVTNLIINKEQRAKIIGSR